MSLNKKQNVKGGKRVKEKESKKSVQNNSKETLSKEDESNINRLEREMAKKNRMPKEEIIKIDKKIFENITIANVIMLFLYFISLGSLNIETEIFIKDLKVFSIGLIVLTIILYEISYKRGSVETCIHGIECMFLSFFVLFAIYLYTIDVKGFYLISSSTAYIFAIYYLGKSIILDRIIRKKYRKSINDINEIIKK